MSKKNFYAVKIGKVPGIYKTWQECSNQISGFSGAIFKGFENFEDAENFLKDDTNIDTIKETITEINNNQQSNNVNEINEKLQDKINSLKNDEVIAFVDGSFNTKENKSAFGVILFTANNEKEILYKAFTEKLNKDFIELRNVSAELEGVKEAINWSVKFNKRKITIYYDYEGIENWANGKWNAKKNITQDYVKFIEKNKIFINIEFSKVPAHSGIQYNEEVDSIAKQALLRKGFKSYDNGSVYFTGYSIDEWKKIIDSINSENSVLDNNISNITYTTEQIGKRTQLKICQDKMYVTINCYNNKQSYVQGKQTVLLQKIISNAIEQLNNKQEVIETLNNYHALTIKQIDVEKKFTQLVPNYKYVSNKHYSNLLTAVYNTMLTGYMPDYTCLVTPIFRAYEYYLHKILGDKMGLNTTYPNGTNKFTYFTKNQTNAFECTSSAKNKLQPEQLDYLNNFYTRYHNLRHPYSHWSANDIDVAVITKIEDAREYILEGLELIDKYYTLF